MPQPPQLLVSVRNPDEALNAIAGGCDILDIKEPSQGSLGMAAVESITAIVHAVRSGDTAIPVSAALGETVDWSSGKTVPSLPVGLQYVKLGTAGLKRESDWSAAWLNVRQRFENVAAGRLNWIAVAYADWQRAASPPRESVIAAAANTGCAGVLFDTFHKDGRTLFDEISSDSLSRFLREIHAHGMIGAVAGSLADSDLPLAVSLQPDIIAVRTAACVDRRRVAAICPHAVRRLQETIATETSRER